MLSAALKAITSPALTDNADDVKFAVAPFELDVETFLPLALPLTYNSTVNVEFEPVVKVKYCKEVAIGIVTVLAALSPLPIAKYWLAATLAFLAASIGNNPPPSPSAPALPVAPVAPFCPVEPVGPVAPSLPSEPAGPVGPTSPFWPVGPVGPVPPVGPVEP